MTIVVEPGSLLHLWQFPELDPSPQPVSPPTLPAANDRDSDAEIAASALGDDARAINAIIQQRIADGYAEGLERGLMEGRKKGYAAGVEAGTEEATKPLAEQARRLAAIVTRLGAPIRALERPVEEAVVALALEVARCVIGSEISRSREHLVRLIREAIAKVPIEIGALRVVMNPADLELVRALAPEIENGSGSLVGDSAIEPGGCLVAADGQGAGIKDMRWQPRAGEGMSQVDLTLATRWRAVMLALFEGEEK